MTTPNRPHGEEVHQLTTRAVTDATSAWAALVAAQQQVTRALAAARRRRRRARSMPLKVRSALRDFTEATARFTYHATTNLNVRHELGNIIVTAAPGTMALYLNPSAGATFENGVRTDNGLVIISYDLPVPDTTAPTASPTQSPAANAAGWNTSDVTVSWNWSDDAGGSSTHQNGSEAMR